jgi:hypothetical protein
MLADELSLPLEGARVTAQSMVIGSSEWARR